MISFGLEFDNLQHSETNNTTNHRWGNMAGLNRNPTFADYQYVLIFTLIETIDDVIVPLQSTIILNLRFGSQILNKNNHLNVCKY